MRYLTVLLLLVIMSPTIAGWFARTFFLLPFMAFGFESNEIVQMANIWNGYLFDVEADRYLGTL